MQARVEDPNVVEPVVVVPTAVPEITAPAQVVVPGVEAAVLVPPVAEPIPVPAPLAVPQVVPAQKAQPVEPNLDTLDNRYLNYAATGQTQKLDYVTRLEVNLFATDVAGMTALHLALLGDHRETVKIILTKENKLFETVNAKTQLTALQTLASLGLCDPLRWMLEFAASDEKLKSIEIDFNKLYEIANVDAKKLLANLQLFKAAKQGNLDALKAALAMSADINAISSNNETALHIAVDLGHKNIIDFLVNHELIKLNLCNKYSQTAREVASVKKDAMAMHIFANNALLTSVINNDEDGVSKALIAGAAVKEVNNAQGENVMHIAAEMGHLKILNMIIESGDLLAKDKMNQIPLHKAFQSGNKTIIKLLLRQHAIKVKSYAQKDSNQKFPQDLAGTLEARDEMMKKSGRYEALYKVANTKPISLWKEVQPNAERPTGEDIHIAQSVLFS